MKILLIVIIKKNASTERLIGMLEKMNAVFSVFPLDASSESIKKHFSAFLRLFSIGSRESAPTHILLTSPLSIRWYDFLAGFSCGAKLPLLVYGKDTAAAIPEGFAPCFKIFKTEISLSRYLEAENDSFKKLEDAAEIRMARETLLNKGVSVNEGAFAQCAAEGSIQDVSLFLAAGFSPDTRDKAGLPLLNISARKGNRELVKFLIKSGANLNLLADDRGTSALIESAMGKHYDLAKDLLEAGADMNIRSKDGQSALIVAVGAGDEGMVELLLKAGADPDIPDNLGVSARKYATLFRHAAIISLFENYAPGKSA